MNKSFFYRLSLILSVLVMVPQNGYSMDQVDWGQIVQQAPAFREITYGQIAKDILVEAGGPILKWGVSVAMTAGTTYALHKTIENIDKVPSFFTYTTKVKDAYIPIEKMGHLPRGEFGDWKGCIKRRLEKPLSWMDLIHGQKEEDTSWDVGYKMKPGMVLYGPPGTGKSSAARGLARKLKIPYIEFSGADFSTEVYVGSAQKPVRDAIRELNTFVERKGDCVCLIDEADSMGSRQDRSNSHNFNVINMFLQAIPASLSSRVHLIFATNYLDRIDPGLIRDGRLACQRLSYPRLEDRIKALAFHAKSRKMYTSAHNYLLNEMAINTDYFTYAELADLINMSACAVETQIAHEIRSKRRASSDEGESEKSPTDSSSTNKIPLRAIAISHLSESLKWKASVKEMVMRSQLLERNRADQQVQECDLEQKEAVKRDVEELKLGITKISNLVATLNKELDSQFVIIDQNDEIVGTPSIRKKTPWHSKLLSLTLSTLNSKPAYLTYCGLGVSTAFYLNYIGFWNRTIQIPLPQQ